MRVIPLLFIPGALSVKNSFNIRKAFGRLPFILIGLAFWIFIYVIFSKVLQYFKGVEVFRDILQAAISFIIVIVINAAYFFIPLKIGVKSMETEKWT